MLFDIACLQGANANGWRTECGLDLHVGSHHDKGEHSFDFLSSLRIISLPDIMLYYARIGAKPVCLEKDIFNIRGCVHSIISYPLYI